MSLYTIYAKPEAGPDAIAVLGDRFSWFAFLVTPLWALLRGAVAFFCLWAVIAIGLYRLAPHIGDDAAIVLYLVFALWAGYAAPQIAGRVLRRRDWITSGELVAPDTETAERLWLERTYGARP
ncbi:hypothetical protein [Pelagibacterium luteolum]|uniref:DUF2628 domain-containing protein n=1 Tax=Pelagibacterium luteolum TaxID=440168 RepID=A0A1G7SIX3_9HYPH|nr:hypothetical protein [Pelagibacterium luteolum]SDG22824.1 hypothetical protein SAMN04487974_101533 [Pelagibacterium luteolum]